MIQKKRSPFPRSVSSPDQNHGAPIRLRGDRNRQRVVIVDDQATGRAVLEGVVGNIGLDIEMKTFADPLRALAACQDQPPDLLITDYRMAALDGIEVIRLFREIPGCSEVPIVVVTIVEDKTVRYRALEAGATDFLTRPFDHYECQARCRNLLELRRQQKLASHRAANLERQIELATRQVRRREQETLYCLARAGEFRDQETGNHIQRMAHYSLAIAEALGLDPAFREELRYAAPMHDIGKIGIPDAILLKAGRLSEEEWAVMKRHTLIGHDILARATSPCLQMAASIALCHHERWDGSGYPHGLRGEEIPIESRIVAIADTLDALTSRRPYKDPWSLERAIGYIREQSSNRFDPACVTAFLAVLPRIEAIHRRCHDQADCDSSFFPDAD